MFETLIDLWPRYRKDKMAVVALLLISFEVLLGLITPLFAREPFILSLDTFQLPNGEYLFGTDNLGRCVFSRVLYGIRTSFLVGALTCFISTIIGIIAGITSGYCGGIVDIVVMRITEIFQVIPHFFLALVFVAFFGSSIWNVVFVLSILQWPSSARLMRAECITIKNLPYVEAARATGLGGIRIALGEVFPNAADPIIFNTTIQFSQAVLTEASLSFLGLGDPNVVSWGMMLFISQVYIRRAWWMLVFPALALITTSILINLIGRGINAAMQKRVA